MRKTFLVLCLFVFLSASLTYAQETAMQEAAEIRAEINHLHTMEQEAFKKGDCEKTISFFDENVTFYANGRRAPSLEFILSFCKQIPRPFEESGTISDTTFVLSEKSAYTLRRIEFMPEDESTDSFNREIITKIWSKTPAGWKIVHFHSSVSSVPNR